MSDLKLRFLSAIVLGPAVLAATYYGGFPFVALVTLAGVLFLSEWLTMTGTAQFQRHAVAGYAAVFLAAGLYFYGQGLACIGIILLGAGLVYGLAGFSREGRWAAEGVLYSGLASYSLLAARSGEGGVVFVFFLLTVVWATDIFAYFAGRTFGGPKLWARVSPKKTWSGAIGGLVSAVILGVGLVHLFGQQELGKWAMLAFGLSVISQAGDLLESAIKRRFNVKDSGGLIPGHGGIMDRVDGLVAPAILAAGLGLLLGGTVLDPISGLGLG